MSALYYESSLAHHGIKGQKWGVRRFQNPDGSLTSAGRNRSKRNAKLRKYPYDDLKFTLKYNGIDQDRYFNDVTISKKNTAQHIGKEENIDLKNDRMYVSVTPGDNDKYVTAMTRELMSVFGKESYKHIYGLNEDLKIPSKEKAIRIFKKVYEENKEQTIKDLDNALEVMKLSDDSFSEMVLGYKWDLQKDKLYDTGYDLLNLSLGIREMDNHTKTHSKYFEELSKAGYNAIVDEFDNISTLKSELPLIVIDAKKSLKPKGSSTKITKEDLKKASKTTEYLNELLDEMEAFAKIAKITKQKE